MLKGMLTLQTTLGTLAALILVYLSTIVTFVTVEETVAQTRVCSRSPQCCVCDLGLSLYVL